MKKLLVLLSIIFMVSCSSGNDIGKVTAESGLNMRLKPNPKSKVILTIPYGVKAKILDHNGPYYQTDDIKARWKKVVYKKKVGWVYSRYFLNEKIIEEMIIVKIKEKPEVPLLKIDTSKAVSIKMKAFYNAMETNIPVYVQPSLKAQIKDYLRPHAWISTVKKISIKNRENKIQQWFYDQEVGWVPRFLLKELSVGIVKTRVKKVLPRGQFYNVSEILRKKAIKAFEAGGKYNDVVNSVLRNIAYFDISYWTDPTLVDT